MQKEAVVVIAGDLPFMRLVCCKSRFHEVEPQKDLELMAPQPIISQRLLKRNPRIIPYPALSEKTLVLSECAVVATKDTPDGQLSLMVRCVASSHCCPNFTVLASLHDGLTVSPGLQSSPHV